MDNFLRFRDDEPHDEPAVTLDAFVAGSQTQMPCGSKPAMMRVRSSRILSALRLLKSPSQAFATVAAIQRRVSCAKRATEANFVPKAMSLSINSRSCAGAALTVLRHHVRLIHRSLKLAWRAIQTSISARRTVRSPSGSSGMADAARQRDLIDSAPRFTPADAAAIDARWDGVETGDMLRGLLADPPFKNIALVSSFGAESAVLLHLIAEIDRTTPLIFINTQRCSVRHLPIWMRFRSVWDSPIFASIGPIPIVWHKRTRRACAGPMIPMAAATCAKWSHCVARCRALTPGFRAARLSGEKPHRPAPF